MKDSLIRVKEGPIFSAKIDFVYPFRNFIWIWEQYFVLLLTLSVSDLYGVPSIHFCVPFVWHYQGTLNGVSGEQCHGF